MDVQSSLKQSTDEHSTLSNEAIAIRLEAIAELLEAQRANPYRVQAYRTAAVTLRNIEPAGEILENEGLAGLMALPGIGESLARSIAQIAFTGRLELLEQLQGEVDPEQVLATVPGVGPELASRIHRHLGIETLAELESATYDGRLETVPGLGQRRIRGIRESLAGRLHRRPRELERRYFQPAAHQPPVAELLDVDREYREKANARQLPRIAPRRFNPTNEAWLPILHTERGTTHYTALFSNTAHAHELGMIHDWVVIYRDDADGAGQWTVVTAHYGPLRNKRIVRGREVECQTHYQRQDGSPSVN
jgi:DNA uptake protein ComE-like DNA-binding protein